MLAGLVRNIFSHGLLTDQSRYFNGSLNHVYCLKLSVTLPGLNVELFLWPLTAFHTVKTL